MIKLHAQEEDMPLKKTKTKKQTVGEEKSRALDFFLPTFFSPLPTFPRPTICPWVSEDD